MITPVMEMHIVKEGQKYDQTLVHQRVAVSQIATFAMQLISTMGMQPNIIDGNNPDGTPRYRLMLPDEIVARSADIAAAAFTEFDKRGWSAPVPAMATLLHDPPQRTGF